MKKLMVSGYKMPELGIFNQASPAIPFIKKAIENRLRVLLDDGYEWVLIGGQLGVELWTAEVVLELKQEYPQLKLAIVTPFLDQEKNWKEETQLYYQQIVQQADIYTSTSEYPYTSPKQFQNRDDAALRKTNGLLLLYDEEREGSPKFLKTKAEKHANNVDYPLYIIDFYELQSVIEEEQQKGDWDE